MGTQAAKKTDFLINGTYKLAKRIGGGSFGEIFEAYNVNDSEGADKVCAVKIERATCKNPQLYQEYSMYRLLNNTKGQASSSHGLPRPLGIPRVFFYGQENDYNILVMEMLGPSVEDLFNYCAERFTVPTVAMLAEQMIERVWYIHERNWIHRDMKPDNFLMGVENKCDIVYVIDFGLAKKFNRDGLHVKFRDGKSLTGTARYVSQNVHRGYEQSRRDDLEALGHVFIYLLRGKLPWQGLNGRTRREKYEKIAERKYSIGLEVLCSGFPDHFVEYMVYCRSLAFDQTPDYMYLLGIFRKLLKNCRTVPRFDWIEQKTAIAMAGSGKGTEKKQQNAASEKVKPKVDLSEIRGAAKKKQKLRLSIQDRIKERGR